MSKSFIQRSIHGSVERSRRAIALSWRITISGSIADCWPILLHLIWWRNIFRLISRARVLLGIVQFLLHVFSLVQNVHVQKNNYAPNIWKKPRSLSCTQFEIISLTFPCSELDWPLKWCIDWLLQLWTRIGIHQPACDWSELPALQSYASIIHLRSAIGSVPGHRFHRHFQFFSCPKSERWACPHRIRS